MVARKLPTTVVKRNVALARLPLQRLLPQPPTKKNSSSDTKHAMNESDVEQQEKTVEEDFGELLPMGSEFNIDAAAEEASAEIAAKSAVNGIEGDFSMIVRPGDDNYNAYDGDDDGVGWSVDTSKEAQEAYMRDLGVNPTVLKREAKQEEEKYHTTA